MGSDDRRFADAEGNGGDAVIFLTAKTIVAEIQGMKDLGAAGALIKPFDPPKLAVDVLAP